MRVERIGNATLYLADCREILPTLGRVDAVITSPPYANQRDYGSDIGDWTDLVSTLRMAHADAQILVNLGLIFRDGELVEYWDGFKRNMRASGWKLFGWYIWDKGFGMPSGDQKNRPITAHEWVFHFNKRTKAVNKWVRTQDRIVSGTGIRQADGTMNGRAARGEAGQPYKAPDSVIRLPPHQARGGIENEHPAVFPVALAEHITRTHTNAGETVLDVFLGSGTTGVACAKLGRSFIGIEIEPRYFDIACKRIEEAQRQSDLFVSLPHAEDPANTRIADLFAEPEL